MNEAPIDAIRQLTKAWRGKDRAGMDFWLDEAIVEVGPTFPAALIGKADFFGKYREYFESPRRILSYRIASPRTIPISRGTVLVTFRYTMKVADGGVVEHSAGKESMIVVRRRGRWRIRFVHWHRDR